MQSTRKIPEIDLVINADGSVYHLHLRPENLADTIILVGDPGRVEKVSKYFDHIEIKKNNREFISHTGHIGKKRITVLSTGIGTGNIDIVLNELDALVNIDLEKRIPKQHFKSLNIIRLGTCGCLQREIPVNSFLVSAKAVGLDSLLHYYKRPSNVWEAQMCAELTQKLPVFKELNPYICSPSATLLDTLGTGIQSGITLTTPGFFGPQGRYLRAECSFPDLMHELSQVEVAGLRFLNFEMETAGLYGMAAALGHNALSFSVVVTNLSEKTFNYDSESAIDLCIRQLLTIISERL